LIVLTVRFIGSDLDQTFVLFLLFFYRQVLDDFTRVADGYAISGNIFGHDTASANCRVVADRDTWQYDDTTAEPDSVSDLRVTLEMKIHKYM
jgi:hypothetical protein